MKIGKIFGTAVGIALVVAMAGVDGYGQVRRKKVVKKSTVVAKKKVLRKGAAPAAKKEEPIRKFTVVGTPVDLSNTYRVAGDGAPNYRGPVDANSPSNSSGQNKYVSGGVLNGKAVRLPAPVYPAAARAVRAGGAVGVQVIIDEEGNIISAQAVSGHPLLRASSVTAARGAKFLPVKLSGQPVKVSGIITYNYVP